MEEDKAGQKALSEKYLELFGTPPRATSEEDGFSLAQPTPFEIVEAITTSDSSKDSLNPHA